MEKYEGEYVAIVGGEIVAHGTDGKKVYDRARREREATVLWLWLVSLITSQVRWAWSARACFGRKH
jgi:hypothetical protein